MPELSFRPFHAILVALSREENRIQMERRNDERVLLTLNTHSLMMPDNAACLRSVADAFVNERVDVLALQEVNQERTAPVMDERTLQALGYRDGGSACPVKEGNFAVLLARELLGRGLRVQWTWAFAHVGYDRYDEGLALISREDVLQVGALNISAPEGRCARVVPYIRTMCGPEPVWCYAAHMGWWQDQEDPFLGQWEKLSADALRRSAGGTVYLMGDFNSPAHIRGEGYDRMLQDGWQDCYTRAAEKDGGMTVGGKIDGWRDGKDEARRIDFVLTRGTGETLSSRVIFNGDFYPVVSDHYGVLTKEA